MSSFYEEIVNILRTTHPNGDELNHAAHAIEDLSGLLLWALYHHQGSSSPVGQPIRRALRMGQHDPLTVDQIRAGSNAAAAAMKPN